jgi:hypothetical protein
MPIRMRASGRRFTVDNTVENLDVSMKMLRESMSGLVLRTAGFKQEHDEAARRIADLSVSLTDAAILVEE